MKQFNLNIPFIRLLLVLFFAVVPFLADAQELQDHPYTEEQLRQYSGLYNITTDESDEVVMQIRFYAQNDQLYGQINGNDPTRMMQQEMHLIRPQVATDWLITLAIEDDLAKSLTITSPDGSYTGFRVEFAEDEQEHTADGGLTSGELFDELGKLDKKLFDAAFVTCNTEIRNSLFTEDVEFYHDIGGLSIGEAVKVPITNCPADRGVTRQLVEGSLEVYLLNNYGAIQRGKHLFIEEGAPNMTIAKFAHIWMESEGGWKISRVLSFDHQQIPRSE